MQCLKCGNKTSGNQVFCDDCLCVMQQYPVKPGIPIHLPQREGRAAEKKPSTHREPTPTEAVDQLRTTIRWLLAALAIVSVVLLCTAAMLIHTLDQSAVRPNIGKNDIGKNYTTTDSLPRP